MGLVTVTIKVEDGAAAPIDGVTCRVFTDPADVFVTQGLTGNPNPGTGEAEISLNGDVTGIDYFVRLSKDGVSFLPSATVGISVTDPPNPNNTFTFTGTVGETAVLVTMVVEDDQAVPQPVEDVRIRVFDATDTFVTELETDSSGEAEVVLDGDPDPGRDYIVRLFKSGWTFPNGNTQVIQVHEPVVAPATNTFDFEASEYVLPASSHPNMCLISGYIGNQARQAMKGVALRFLPQVECPDAYVSGFPFPGDPTVVDEMSLLAHAKFTTDADGYVEILLPRGATFDCHIYGLETPGVQIVHQIYVPDAAAASLEDVLFPYVASVEWDKSSIAIAVEGTGTLTPTVIGSNLQNIYGSVPIGALLEFSSDDEDVATVELQDDATLLITGLSAGTANISVARIDNTWAARQPPIDALVVTPVTQVPITVS